MEPTDNPTLDITPSPQQLDPGKYHLVPEGLFSSVVQLLGTIPYGQGSGQLIPALWSVPTMDTRQDGGSANGGQ